ncbi:helix-turn-helix domain-containing protein [Calidifontibacillus oryziterrae]|uniref:helix-turn-helix domain-containing protein n=1 Tax=Calidifontibacillus oryziterrae TaxID=1191699 RepID=UPI00031589D2|nr:helix-turn-helix transcriptional regulator [Calidifontibacillus oryziterrae]
MDKSLERKIISEIIGKHIRLARTVKHNLTLENTTELTDLDYNNLAKIERGEQLPSVPTLVKLYETLGISFDEIFDEIIKALAEMRKS